MNEVDAIGPATLLGRTVAAAHCQTCHSAPTVLGVNVLTDTASVIA